MQSSKKLPNKSKKASIQVPLLRFYRKGQWSEHYLGLADPEKESQ